MVSDKDNNPLFIVRLASEGHDRLDRLMAKGQSPCPFPGLFQDPFFRLKCQLRIQVQGGDGGQRKVRDRGNQVTGIE
jgi:hypothetical protein